jgi:peptide/nickel transport system permease protein
VVQTTPGTAARTAPVKPSFGKRFKKSFKTFPMVYVGATIVILLVLMAVFAPVLATHPYATQYNSGLSSTGLPVGPNHEFILGTDGLGRDEWSRMVYGARVSLIVGVFATVLSLVIGVTAGLFAGFFGGWVDQVIMRITDTMLAFPFILFAMALVAVLSPSLQNILIALGVTGWGVMARIVRGLVLQLKESEYVQAERAVGASKVRIIFHVILPNTFGPIIIFAMLNVGGAMLAEAALSYLGIGIQPPTPSWGNMIQDGMQTYQFAPWTLWTPGVALIIAVLGFNLLGDGLRDILDPHNMTH